LAIEINPKNKLATNSQHIGQYADLEEIRLHYEEAGEGEAVLLIHTLGQSMYTWHGVFNRLAEHYRVVAVDLPGHGYSEKYQDPGRYGITSIGNELIALMDSLEIDRAHVAAFSMGSMYALDMAERFPQRVGRMILECPGGLTNTMPRQIRSFAGSLTGWLSGMTLSEKTVDALLTDAYFDQTLITDHKVREYYKPFQDKDTVRSVRDALREFDETSVLAALQDVESDVLILWGVDDRWRDVSTAEIFHVALPRVEFGLVRNCGHVLHEEKSEKYLSYAVDFFENGIERAEEE